MLLTVLSERVALSLPLPQAVQKPTMATINNLFFMGLFWGFVQWFSSIHFRVRLPQTFMSVLEARKTKGIDDPTGPDASPVTEGRSK